MFPSGYAMAKIVSRQWLIRPWQSVESFCSVYNNNSQALKVPVFFDYKALIKPLLHFHGFDPGLLRFGTVVTPAKFGPGSTLSTVLLPVAYRGGQRGRFAPGGTLREAAKKGKRKRKKEKKGKKEKKEKREKENIMGEACNFSKTIKLSILAAAPMQV